MSNVVGLYGYNRALTSVNKLFACYGNDIVDVDSGTGFSQNISTAYNGEFETYLDYCFFANGYNAPRSFNGSAWSTLGIRNNAPIFKYLKTYANRLYGGYVTVN